MLILIKIKVFLIKIIIINMDLIKNKLILSVKMLLIFKNN